MHIFDLPTDSLEQQLRTACLLEAIAPKAGNVHPGVSFEDLTFSDFVISAKVVAPVLACAHRVGVGQTILDAVLATSGAVGTNTNLGILLLLAPLAAVPEELALTDGVAEVLCELTMEDTRLIYEAIRIAHPGGLGSAESQDVAEAPTVSILEAMQLSETRDRIARQYVTNFEDVLHFGVETFLNWVQRTHEDANAIVGLQLTLLSIWPDSLIQRKNGSSIAKETCARARYVLDQNWPDGSNAKVHFAQFDKWLREDQHQRNPGTTADLIAAILFAALRDHSWSPRM